MLPASVCVESDRLNVCAWVLFVVHTYLDFSMRAVSVHQMHNQKDNEWKQATISIRGDGVSS